jgi:hypothetical protein
MALMKREKQITIEMSESELSKILLEYFRLKKVLSESKFNVCVTYRADAYGANSRYSFVATETIKSDNADDLKDVDLKDTIEVKEKPNAEQKPLTTESTNDSIGQLEVGT